MTQIAQATSWSFSKLKDFGKCKLMYKIKHIDRVPEPARPLPPGKLEHANDRGSRIHDSAEQYVRDKAVFIPELTKFKLEFEHLKHLFGQGKVVMEQEWGHDKDWNIAPWKTAWLRLKLDIMVHVSEVEAVVIDIKTGKKFGNEITHAQQLQLYALVAFLRFPKLEIVHSENWYTDIDDITQNTFTRDQSLRFKRSFNTQGQAITNCLDWPANPNRFSCQWCPYGPDGTGHCAVGVRK